MQRKYAADAEACTLQEAKLSKSLSLKLTYVATVF